MRREILHDRAAHRFRAAGSAPAQRAAARRAGRAAASRPAPRPRRNRPPPARQPASASSAGRRRRRPRRLGERGRRRLVRDQRQRPGRPRRPARRSATGEPPRPAATSRSACQLSASSAWNWPALAQRQGRARPLPPVTLTVRWEPGRHPRAARAGLQEQRRQAGIGRRRDPGLHHASRARPGRPAGPGRSRAQARRSVRPGDHQRATSATQQPHAQRRAVPRRQARPRRPTRKRGDLRRSRGLVHAPRPRSPPASAPPSRSCNAAQRPVPQAGRPLQPPVRQSRRWAARPPQPPPQQQRRGGQQHDREQREPRPGRQKGRHVQQGRRGDSAEHAQRGPDRRPKLLEPQHRPRQRRACGRGGRARPAAGVTPASPGRLARPQRLERPGAARITDHRPPSTITSAASGRAL